MIILIGVSGVGKSTQGNLLIETGLYQWFSVGQFLRDEVSDPVIQKKVKAGEFLSGPHELMLIEDKILSLGDKPELIVDGFPRNHDQADWLVAVHKRGLVKINKVIHLTADEDVARQRLLLRGRDDDSEEVIAKRFKEYRNSILPIVNNLKEAGLDVADINGQQTVAQVQSDIKKALNL